MGSLNHKVNYPALIQRSLCCLSPLGVYMGLCCSHNTMYHFRRANIASWNSLCDSFVGEGKRNAQGKAENTKGKERRGSKSGPKGKTPEGRLNDARVQEKPNQRTKRGRKT